MTRFLLIEAAIILGALAPLLLSLAAGAIANAAGCTLNESQPTPCVVLGVNVGPALYTLGTVGWLSLITLPLGAVLFVGYAVYGVIGLLRMRGGG